MWLGDDQADGQSNDYTAAALFESLQARIADLREQLEQAHERDRENRRIIAALTQRIPELPPGPSEGREEAPGASADGSEG